MDGDIFPCNVTAAPSFTQRMIAPLFGLLAGFSPPITNSHGWVRSDSRAERTDKVELTFAVKQPAAGVDRLVEKFHAVSTPGSPHYGKHLSNEEVHALVSPTRETIQTVEDFLASHGVKGHWATLNGDLISAEVTFEQAENEPMRSGLNEKWGCGRFAQRGWGAEPRRHLCTHLSIHRPSIHPSV